MLRGIDVSAAQGPIDWPSLKAWGLRFAYVKCGEGNKPAADPHYLENVAGARALGLAVGPYLFAYPLPPTPGKLLLDPAEQAAHHFALSAGVGSRQGDLPPALDLEWPPPSQWGKWGCSPKQLQAWALAYLDKADALWGTTVALYTYSDFWTNMRGALEARFIARPAWLASYPRPYAWPTEGTKVPVIPPWTRSTFWQWTGGELYLPNGVPVDGDIFNGTEEDFAAIVGRGAAQVAHDAIAEAVASSDPGQPTPPEDLPPSDV